MKVINRTKTYSQYQVNKLLEQAEQDYTIKNINIVKN